MGEGIDKQCYHKKFCINKNISITVLDKVGGIATMNTNTYNKCMSECVRACVRELSLGVCTSIPPCESGFQRDAKV